MKRKTAIKISVLAVLVAAPLLLGLVEPKHLSFEVRGRTFSAPGWPIAATTDTTQGVNGLVSSVTTVGYDGGFAADAGHVADAGFAADAGHAADAGNTADAAAFDAAALDAQALDAAPIDGGTFSDDASITQSTPAAMPYAAPLRIILIDGGSATSAALTCTSVTVFGTDQFGTLISETVPTITETASYTSRGFSTVTRGYATGCAGANDSSDVLQISLGTKVALPYRIRVAGDILSASFVDSSASNDVITYSAAELSAASAISTTYMTVDLAASGLPRAKLADGDSVNIRLLPRLPLP